MFKDYDCFLNILMVELHTASMFPFILFPPLLLIINNPIVLYSLYISQYSALFFIWLHFFIKIFF